MKVAISDFVRRQTADSRFSHFEGAFALVQARVEMDFDKAQRGYREGVLLVPLSNVDGFYSATCLLQEGDKLVGTYEPRRKGEAPRRQTGVVGGQKQPAARVDVVLYRADLLAENSEQTKQADGSYAEWEIISINAAATPEEEPMSVGTLLANHFHKAGSNDGGTSTGLTDAEFIAKLQESYSYWKDKALAAAE